MMRLLLVRHGHVDGIDPPRFRGGVDLALTDLGRAQALATAQRVAGAWPVQRVYTSPMRRAVDTGAAIAAQSGCGAEVLPRLSDMDYGSWQGLTHAEVEAAEPAAYALWRWRPDLVRPGGGDSLQDLALRTADALRLLLSRHADGTVVLVGHDSINRALLLQVQHQPLSAYWSLTQSPCGLSEIELDGPSTRLVRLNETAHLE